MKRVATINELADLLTDGLTWRVREISSLHASLRKAPSVDSRPIVRAAMALLYAHWEGYIKHASEVYIGYLSARSVRYMDMPVPFWLLAVHPQIRYLESARRSVSDKIRVLGEMSVQLTQTTRRLSSKGVTTRSNLNFDALSDVCGILNISVGVFEQDRIFLDVLVEKRNHIAHGEEVYFEAKEFQEASDRLFDMMRRFRTEIENAALAKAYLKSA